jgi:hypothetical protein
MIRTNNKARVVWEGQGWLAEKGYKEPDDLMAALEELANLDVDATMQGGRSPEQYETWIVEKVRPFEEKWPDFLQSFDKALGKGHLHDHDVEDNPYNRSQQVLNWRDSLREVWRGSSGTLEELLYESEEEPGYGGDEYSMPWEPYAPPVVRLDWGRREFVYTPQSPFQAACYLLLKNSHLAKVCANPNCTGTRYFIADKAQRRFCSKQCFEPIQQERSLDWWNRVGKFKRAAAKGNRKKSKRARHTQ